MRSEIKRGIEEALNVQRAKRTQENGNRQANGDAITDRARGVVKQVAREAENAAGRKQRAAVGEEEEFAVKV